MSTTTHAGKPRDLRNAKRHGGDGHNHFHYRGLRCSYALRERALRSAADGGSLAPLHSALDVCTLPLSLRRLTGGGFAGVIPVSPRFKGLNHSIDHRPLNLVDSRHDFLLQCHKKRGSGNTAFDIAGNPDQLQGVSPFLIKDFCVEGTWRTTMAHWMTVSAIWYAAGFFSVISRSSIKVFTIAPLLQTSRIPFGGQYSGIMRIALLFRGKGSDAGGGVAIWRTRLPAMRPQAGFIVVPDPIWQLWPYQKALELTSRQCTIDLMILSENCVEILRHCLWVHYSDANALLPPSSMAAPLSSRPTL